MFKKIGLIILGIFVLLSIGVVTVYNTLLTKDELVKYALSNLEATLQRRLDLVPNLVNTVKGYALYESKTLKDVIEARAKAMATTVNLESAESVAAFQKAHGEVGGMVSRLMAVVEQYPILKASETFRDLMVQLEGTENRINIGRQNLNGSIQEYNLAIRRFPASLVNRMFVGLHPKVSFTADAAAHIAPKVDFSH